VARARISNSDSSHVHDRRDEPEALGWHGGVAGQSRSTVFGLGRRDLWFAPGATRKGTGFLQLSREPKHAVRKKKKLSQLLSAPAMGSPLLTLLLARLEEVYRSRALAPKGSQRRQTVTGSMGRIGSKIGKKAVKQVDGRR
jgi:hypothetical protein